MSKKMQTNKILRGNFGRVWVNSELMANVKKFEAKVGLNYEEIQISNDLGTHQRYMGYTIEGTMTLHKIDSQVAHLMKDGIKTGDLPDIKIIAKLDDPSAYGAERIEMTEVTFDELTLMNFENGNVIEEEVPFKAAYFDYLDMIWEDTNG